MTPQFSSKSREKAKPKLISALFPAIAARASRPLISPILRLQQELGNQRVAQLIRAKRLTSQGKLMSRLTDTSIGFQRKPIVSATDQYEQKADRVAQLTYVPRALPASRIQRQLIPPELQTSANVRAMTEKELQDRYDLLVKTMKLMSTSASEYWWLEAEMNNISDELSLREARRQALKSGRTFDDAEVKKMKDYFVRNATSSDPESCIACMNKALRLLLNEPKQKVGSEVEKTMARLQESGHAGSARFIEFQDRKGRITKGTLYPNKLNESVWNAIIEMTGGDVGWSVFGMSLMDGNHSVTLTLDNGDPLAPHLYWSDQWSTKGGWKEYNKTGLDSEITRLTQAWWNEQPEGRKFNTHVTLWRLKR